MERNETKGHLIPVLTAYENVEFAIRLIGHLSEKEIREMVMNHPAACRRVVHHN